MAPDVRILAVIPVHGRIELARLIWYSYQTINVECMAIGTPADLDQLECFNFQYVTKQMFPAKIDDALQNGIGKHLQSFTHILMVGCDDIMLPESLDRMVKASQNYDVVAVSSCYMLDSETRYLVKWPGYPADHHRHGEPCGAFRLYNRAALDRIGWSMYDCSEPAMDAHSWELITRQSTYIILDDMFCVDIKDQYSMTSLDRFDYLLPVIGKERQRIVSYIDDLRRKKNASETTREGV
jgi:hypothetical protein